MKLGILISGRGSNMVAIAEAIENGTIKNTKIGIVISDKSDAPGIEKAKERGIRVVVITRNGRSREDHDAAIIDELMTNEVELVCLAGYMRLLSSKFIDAFPEKIINIHPSLLPSFKGLNAQKQAFEYGVKYTGCTVHFVDEKLDHGKIIAQRVVEILAEDTVETLWAKILAEEHRLYVETIATFSSSS